jgi:hypothetical protein
VGYGYRTWLAGIWLVALAALGTEVFSSAEAHRMMQASPNAPAFHPVAYTLDLLVPIVDLGQRKTWTSHGSALYRMAEGIRQCYDNRERWETRGGAGETMISQISPGTA